MAETVMVQREYCYIEICKPLTNTKTITQAGIPIIRAAVGRGRLGSGHFT